MELRLEENNTIYLTFDIYSRWDRYVISERCGACSVMNRNRNTSMPTCSGNQAESRKQHEKLPSPPAYLVQKGILDICDKESKVWYISYMYDEIFIYLFIYLSIL